MEAREFAVSDQSHLKRVSTYIDSCLRKDTKLTVIVKPFSPNITAAQRGLYWQWMTDIGNEFGDSKQYYHEMFKLLFLVNIFRSNPKKGWYVEMIETLLSVRQYQTPEQVEAVRVGLVRLTSITDANKAEMAEYMNNIKEYAQSEMGYAVRLPDDGLLNY